MQHDDDDNRGGGGGREKEIGAIPYIVSDIQSKYAIARATVQMQFLKLSECTNNKDQMNRVARAAEAEILKTLEQMANVMTRQLAHLFTEQYEVNDRTREQFMLLRDAHHGTIQENDDDDEQPITVISYNGQVHYGSQGRQAPCMSTPFYMEDQTGLGSTEKKKS